jgi:hypothetical protein
LIESIEWTCPPEEKGALTGIKRIIFPEKGRFGARQDVRTGREPGLGGKSDRGTTTAITVATIHHHQFITHNSRSHVWMQCMDGLIV